MALSDLASVKKHGRWLVTSDSTINSDKYDLVVLVCGVSKNSNCLSLPVFINKNQKLIAQKIDSSLRNLAALSLSKDLSISASLNINGIDFWSISGATERCVIRNKKLEQLIRYIAIEVLKEKFLPSHIDYRLNDQFLDKLLKPTVNSNKTLSGWFGFFLRASYRFLSHFFDVVLSKKSFSVLSGKTTVFVDTVNMAKNKGQESTYLPGFSKLVSDENAGPINWVHGYVANSADSKRDFDKIFENFNSIDEDNYVLLESNLTLLDLLKSLVLYMRLQCVLFSVVHRLDKSNEPFWYGVRDSFIRSLVSGSAITMILKRFAYMNVFSRLSDDQKVIYLCEGMPSETMIVKQFRLENRFSKIMGFHPSAIKTGDFRLNRYLSGDSLSPDAMLVNSFEGISLLSYFGFDEGKLLPIEGLRFEYLTKMASPSPSSTTVKVQKPLIILYLLEGLENADKFLLDLLSASEHCLSSLDVKFTIRKHPADSRDISDYLTLATNLWELSSDPLSELFEKADIICASVNSSVIVEAMYWNKHVINLFNPQELLRTPFKLAEISPLVSSEDDFIREIKTTRGVENVPPYFILDNEHAHWKAALKSL